MSTRPIPPADRLALRELLAPWIDAYTVVDVGAYGTGEPDVYVPALIDDSMVVGFEPNAEECARLNRQASSGRRFHPVAIGDGGPQVFHVCKAPMTSSLLRPNTALLECYENLAELCEVTQELPIQTVRLDDVQDMDAVDFLKIDIQGATLPALQGANRVLGSTLVVHAETEFVQIYSGESLFSECELFLRDKGFMFHHFHRMEGCRMVFGGYAVGRRASQSLWADAVFVPALHTLDRMADRSLVRLAWTMHTVYGACDFAMACLARCRHEGALSLAGRYHALLSAHGMIA